MSEFYQALIRAEWQTWSFGAHQAAARAAAAEDLIALRRQFTELAEQDLLRLAHSWRADDKSGPYFAFTAADATPAPAPAELATVLLDAAYIKALFHELADQALTALPALLDQWSEQRRHAAYAGLRPTPSRPPRVTLLIPRDNSQWPPASWDRLLTLDLDSPAFDGARLRWDTNSELWLPRH